MQVIKNNKLYPSTNLRRKSGLLFLVSFLFFLAVKARSIDYTNAHDIIQLNDGLSIFEDSSSALSAREVMQKDSFNENEQNVPNFGVSESTFWLKFSVRNSSKDPHLLLGLSYPLMDQIELYQTKAGKVIALEKYGDLQPFSNRKYQHQNFLFDLNIDPGTENHYLLKVSSWELLTVPLFVGTVQRVFEANQEQDLLFGLFFGIMLVLILYNLFIFLTVKDKSYLFYVLYIMFICLTQATIFGYTSRILFPTQPEFSNLSLVLFNSIAGIFTIEFIKRFIKTQNYTPYLHKGFMVLTAIYCFGIITNLLGFKGISYSLMDLGGLLIAVYTLFVAIKISLKGYRPAKIFLLAWSVFLSGVVLFVLKSTGVLPSNLFTNYTMTFGVGIEGIILSIALADRINIYKNETQQAQQKTLQTLQENQKIIKNQNTVLEQKVEERTERLNQVLKDLKTAQVKLVDAEKMSSLGQLTAGIAHEINNPINFISSNINPLRNDLADFKSILTKYEEIDVKSDLALKLSEIDALKQELDYEYLQTELETIISGIQDGAERTKTIVSGLKNFSRLDEVENQYANINECINSTLTIIKSKLSNIEVEKNLSSLPEILCYPGKLNQMFMNLFDNAIYAVNDHGHQPNKKIAISSFVEENLLIVSVKDNGIGMSKQTKEKIFEPFYTTKPVGSGSGLGMSICYSILKLHKAEFLINSKENVGTEIIIKIPLHEN